MKEIKDDINRWRDIPCSWVGRINIVKLTITTKCSLEIQCDPYQITNGIFTVVEPKKKKKKKSQVIWKHKRPQIAKEILRKLWGNQTSSWLQTIQQSCSHQGSMVLAQKQWYRPVEQDRKPRNKPMHLWVSYFWHRRQEYSNGAKTASSINGAGKTGQLHVREWNWNTS